MVAYHRRGRGGGRHIESGGARSLAWRTKGNAWLFAVAGTRHTRGGSGGATDRDNVEIDEGKVQARYMPRGKKQWGRERE